MTHRPLRIALVNDYEIVLAGIREMLAPFRHRIEVVDLANAIEGVRVDIVLYDTFGRTPTEVAHARETVANLQPNRMVLFSWHVTEAMVDDAHAAGVDGVLSKTLGANDLVDSLERLHDGSFRHVDAPPPSQPVRETDWIGRLDGLTLRESEMITLISRGLSNAEIANHTYLSPNSVKSYIRSAYRKIGVSRRSQAVVWGIDHGMTKNPMAAPARLNRQLHALSDEAATGTDTR